MVWNEPIEPFKTFNHSKHVDKSSYRLPTGFYNHVNIVMFDYKLLCKWLISYWNRATGIISYTTNECMSRFESLFFFYWNLLNLSNLAMFWTMLIKHNNIERIRNGQETGLNPVKPFSLKSHLKHFGTSSQKTHLKKPCKHCSVLIHISKHKDVLKIWRRTGNGSYVYKSFRNFQ